MTLQAHATAGEVDFYLSDQGGIQKQGRHRLDHIGLRTMAIFRDKILWKAYNSLVHSHHIELRLNSALIFTVTATFEGQFALLEGW
jgi:hypothetical protein